MAYFDDLKQKAKDTVESIADMSVELYKIAEEKTKAVARTTKLATEIAREKSNLRKLYKDIGVQYYEAHKDNPEEDFVEKCAEITAALDEISLKQQELDKLKAESNIVDEDIQVDIIVDDQEDSQPDEGEKNSVPSDSGETDGDETQD